MEVSKMSAANPTSGAIPARTVPIENRSRMVRLSRTHGRGGECDYCRKTIRPDSIQYQVDARVPAGLRTLQFHRICLHLWETLM
jgi:hypothetical protein